MITKKLIFCKKLKKSNQNDAGIKTIKSLDCLLN